jgi:hypothetical protein
LTAIREFVNGKKEILYYEKLNTEKEGSKLKKKGKKNLN